MRRLSIDRVIHSLLCVRLGQELGSSSELAQAIAGAIDAAISALARFLG